MSGEPSRGLLSEAARSVQARISSTQQALASQNAMTFQVGTNVGRYEIVSLLGAGGMGEVYRARDLTLKRDVAIKVLPETFSKDAERLSRFRREAEVLASLNHPHIATIYDVGESGGGRFLALELVEGESTR